MTMKGLSLATPSLKDVAREAGISYHAVRQYKRGHRVPSPAVQRRLIAAFRGFADDLAKVADDLERTLPEGGKP